MLPYPPGTVPVVWWRMSGLPPRTVPDSEANLNQDGESRLRLVQFTEGTVKAF